MVWLCNGIQCNHLKDIIEADLTRKDGHVLLSGVKKI